MPTKIEWTEETWNPITGCTKISDGCAHCYAERMANRLRGRFGYPKLMPFRPGVIHESQLQKPAQWKRSKMVFVCSMGDLFHEQVDDAKIDRVFDIMRQYPQHTFQVLTKRAQRMMFYARKIETWPSNVWAGVTVENSKPTNIERVLKLAQVNAAVRFVSVEPMLGSVDLRPVLPALQWVICGGETGTNAREMNADWARNLRDQCVAHHVPFFFKKFSDGTSELDGQQWRGTPSNNVFTCLKRRA